MLNTKIQGSKDLAISKILYKIYTLTSILVHCPKYTGSLTTWLVSTELTEQQKKMKILLKLEMWNPKSLRKNINQTDHLLI